MGIDDSKRTRVAVKMIKKSMIEVDRLRGGRLYQKIKLEIQNMQKLDHPNIIKVIDVINDHENYYIILEYC